MWAPNACGPPTGVKMEITEIRWNPPGPAEDDLNGKYIVLCNLSNQPARLGGLTLRDSSSVNLFHFPDGWTCPAEPKSPYEPATAPTAKTPCTGETTYRYGTTTATPPSFLQDPSGNIITHRSYTG